VGKTGAGATFALRFSSSRCFFSEVGLDQFKEAGPLAGFAAFALLELALALGNRLGNSDAVSLGALFFKAS